MIPHWSLEMILEHSQGKNSNSHKAKLTPENLVKLSSLLFLADSVCVSEKSEVNSDPCIIIRKTVLTDFTLLTHCHSLIDSLYSFNTGQLGN